jgi:energy-coupling factor transport system permease protein
MIATFHTKAWAGWFVAALFVAGGATNPAAHVAALAAMGATGAVCGRRAPDTRSMWFFLKIGLAFCLVRVVLFGLTGHAGATTLVTLPVLGLPRWLGGFAIGGRITAEEAGVQIADGLRIATLLVAFGVFLSAVETSRVLRAVPRFMREAGLVVSIALAFFPSMLRTASDVRDAQRLRGHRFRGVRSLRPLVVPVLTGALEHSLELAASMETRGYGRAEKRTRMRATRMTAWDALVLATSALTVAGSIAVRGLPGAHWSAMPAIHPPLVDVRAVLPAFALCAPAVLERARAARLRAASPGAPAPAPISAPGPVGAAR